MSVSESLGGASGTVRKPSAVLVFLPLLIAVLGVAAIILGQMPEASSIGSSGYGIDEMTTGAIGPVGTDPPRAAP